MFNNRTYSKVLQRSLRPKTKHKFPLQQITCCIKILEFGRYQSGHGNEALPMWHFHNAGLAKVWLRLGKGLAHCYMEMGSSVLFYCCFKSLEELVELALDNSIVLEIQLGSCYKIFHVKQKTFWFTYLHIPLHLSFISITDVFFIHYSCYLV